MSEEEKKKAPRPPKATQRRYIEYDDLGNDGVAEALTRYSDAEALDTLWLSVRETSLTRFPMEV